MFNPMKLPSNHSVVALACLALVFSLSGCATSAEATENSPSAEARYTPEGLKQAFANLCARLHYTPIRVEVDQSEYPFIVYGVLEGRCDYRAMRDALGSMPGYAYSGSVVGPTRDGSRTFFALNMIPREGQRADMQQEMERMKALANSQR
jgi:hypothetical protein